MKGKAKLDVLSSLVFNIKLDRKPPKLNRFIYDLQSRTVQIIAGISFILNHGIINHSLTFFPIRSPDKTHNFNIYCVDIRVDI